jgi:hypothetical protein
MTEEEEDLLLCAVFPGDDRLTVAASPANWLTINSVSLQHGISLLVAWMSGSCAVALSPALASLDV